MFAKEWDATKCVYNSASTKSKGDLDRMPKLDGMKKQENLNVLLAEMGFFTNIKAKKIKFNPRPRSNPEHVEWVKLPEPITQEKTKKVTPEFIDLHLDITAKIDEIIKNHEQENSQTKLNNFDKPEFIEVRKPWTRSPTAPQFRTDMSLDDFTNNLQTVDDLFEVKIPETNLEATTQMSTEEIKTEITKELKFDEFENMTVIKKIDSFDEMLSGLGRIKVRKNPNQTKSTPQKTQHKKNGVTVAKTDLDKTKAELERKKHELEEMERIAKEKEEEFKKKQEEKKKQEKLRQQKQKEIEKQRKLKEKLEKKHQIELEKEKKRKQKELLKEQKIQEKLKLAEEKKRQKELEIKKKQQEKEELLKQKQLEKQKKIKEEPKKPKNPIKKPTPGIFAKKKKEKPKQTEEIKTETKPEEVPEAIKEETNQPSLDEEVGEALRIIDDLLEKLPEDTIDEFVQSDDFAVYEKVVSKYKRK